MPENTVYVGRGSKWGNPFEVVKKKGMCGPAIVDYWVVKFAMCLIGGKFAVKAFAIKFAISEFKKWAIGKHDLSGIKPLDVSELKGKDLACWCRLDMPCHADVLLELANDEREAKL